MKLAAGLIAREFCVHSADLEMDCQFTPTTYHVCLVEVVGKTLQSISLWCTSH